MCAVHSILLQLRNMQTRRHRLACTDWDRFDIQFELEVASIIASHDFNQKKDRDAKCIFHLVIFHSNVYIVFFFSSLQ